MSNPLEAPGQKNIQEAPETDFEKISREIRDNGYRFHAQEHDQAGKDPKTYHTSEHPRTLGERAKKMAEILHLSPEQHAVTEMAIAWHDAIIEYDKADPNNIIAMIRRHRGAREGDKPCGAEGNEGKSGELLEREMRKANERTGREIFTEKQILVARWTVDATYPDVNLGPDFKGTPFQEYPFYEVATSQNPDLATVLDELKTQGVTKGPLFFQPHLEKPLEEGKKVPREVLIMALADLGAAGVTEKETFFKEGDDEMRELYANLRRPDVMRRLIEDDEETDRADRQKVTSVFLDWLESQQGFGAWQALRFEKILYLLKQQEDITDDEEEGLRAQFSHFTENIRFTRDRAKELKSKFQEVESTQGEKAAFLYLAQNLHYDV